MGGSILALGLGSGTETQEPDSNIVSLGKQWCLSSGMCLSLQRGPAPKLEQVGAGAAEMGAFLLVTACLGIWQEGNVRSTAWGKMPELGLIGAVLRRL